MKNVKFLAVIVCMMAVANFASADTFGTGDNQFTIDFVPISGSTNPTSGIQTSSGYTFTGVNNSYRMGTYEISNDQWTKFTAAYGTVTGSPSTAYDNAPYWTGMNLPTTGTSWYEAAQFVNWLNISTGHQAAYKFTGTQGQSDYTFTTWDVSDTGYNAGNPYRNSNAFYFLPTQDEWVKAAYWNGASLQTYATKAGESLTQGNGTNGAGWNYATSQPWDVGSGSQELNGTYDMMGNVWEWNETLLLNVSRSVRGGAYYYPYYENANYFMSSAMCVQDPYDEKDGLGFRVASVPEPTTLLLLGLGGVAIRKAKGNLNRKNTR